MRPVMVVLTAIGLTTANTASGRSSPSAPPEMAQAPRSFGITNVTVIDVERGARLRDHTVIIEGGRISTVGPSSQVRVPDGYGVVQARGKFVIPGLVDRHAHVTTVEQGATIVENGATRLARFALHGVSTMAELTRTVLEGAPALQSRAGGPPIPRVHIEEGTDRGGVVPADTVGRSADGVVVHEELRRAVEAGVTPAVALRAVTVDAARALGLQNRVGSVAPGRFADLLILDGNPLEDIRNTARIEAVIVGGRFIDSAERQQLLARLTAR
jgi:imidazolonepropionase-like amidohydrolase